MSGLEGVSQPPTPAVDDTLDELVSKASKPTLADLFKKAKDTGLITTITGYGPNKEKPVDPTQIHMGQGAPSAPPGTITYNALTAKATGFRSPEGPDYN